MNVKQCRSELLDAGATRPYFKKRLAFSAG